MRGRRTFAFSAAALSAVVLSVGVTSAATPATKPIAVTITESKLSVSSRAVNVGAAVFRVANKGKRAHRFTLGGKSTPLIGAGRSATLRVAIPNKGPYVYYSVAPGRAPTFKGALSVIDPCTKPVASTVSVEMREAPMTFSRTTVPCGTVTFTVTNAGTVGHRFDLFQTNPPRTLLHGALLEPGKTATVSVPLLVKGQVNYLCGEAEHGEEYGEIGYVTVT
jgi:hypothetical protein